MKIALHGKEFQADTLPYIQEVFEILQERGAEIIVSKQYHDLLKASKIKVNKYKIYFDKKDLADVHFFISLGGDGTLLESVTHIERLEIPILGINIGRLGFLATTPKYKIKEAIYALYNNLYTYDYRALIRLESDRDIFGDQSFGMNEFAILKKDSSSMIVVHTYIDGEYLNSYWADGLIVATPTGSTGYSLSCGGPLVLPQSNNFVITPVSPHNLNVRPMVVSDDSVISFEIEGRSKNFLVSLDSRSHPVEASIQMAVRKEDFRAKLVKMNGYNFLDTLRQKLNWGLDIRN
jgi:NAD+ kinase